MPRQAREAEKVFQKKHGKTLAQFFDDTKYQLMHLEMFPFGIIHAECIGGEIDLLLNRRVNVGFFPWRFVDGESSIGRCIAYLDDDEYQMLEKQKMDLPKTKFGDVHNPDHVVSINKLTKKNFE